MKIFVEVHTTVRREEYEHSSNFRENESNEIVWDGTCVSADYGDKGWRKLYDR